MKKYFRYILLSLGLISINGMALNADLSQGVLTRPITAGQMLDVLELYRKSRPTITDWSIEKNPDGTIETGWFREHKGEVILKIRIQFIPDATKVTVLQKIGYFWIFSREVSDTEWARNAAARLGELLSQQK